MSKDHYFQKALSNFIFDFSCGGAIRHLAGQGYTARQIADRLSYPVGYARVREGVTEYYLAEGILLREEPVRAKLQEKYVYVREHGKYGRTSFRRVPAGKAGTTDGGTWTEHIVSCGELAKHLRDYAGSTEAGKAYVSCDFGRLAEVGGILNDRQKEYLQGICWEPDMCHLLNGRMSEIVMCLCENGLFYGKVYFMAVKKIFVVPVHTEEN